MNALRNKTSQWLALGMMVLMTASCSSVPEKPIEIVNYVDLPRFMGDWYVIANIPTFIEKQAHNAIESYSLKDAKTVSTIFTFRKGSFDGPAKRYEPTGYVKDHPSNAVWGMRFVWPIKADYRIVYLNEDYSTTVIGRNKRDYVWIMSRTPQIADDEYQRIMTFLKDQGYDTSLIQKVPQNWDQQYGDQHSTSE